MTIEFTMMTMESRVLQTLQFYLLELEFKIAYRLLASFRSTASDGVKVTRTGKNNKGTKNTQKSQK